MGEGLGKTSTALSSGLTCSFWLISCWCHPRIYVTRKSLGKIFTALRYSFLFLRASRKIYNTLLKTSKAGNLSTPFDVYVSFLSHCHFNKISTTQSYEWLRLSLVPELNLLLPRLQIQWSTVKKVKSFSRVRLFVAPWTVAYQAPVRGIFQARILEWVAISFSNAWKWKVKVKSFSRVRLLETPWTAAHQAPVRGIFQARVLEWGAIAFSDIYTTRYDIDS